MALVDIEELEVGADVRSERSLLQAHVQRVGKAVKQRIHAQDEGSVTNKPADDDGGGGAAGARSSVPGTQRIWVKTFG